MHCGKARGRGRHRQHRVRGFHATLLGLSLGPIDTVFTTTGLLMLAGGLYAMVNLRDINPLQP